MDTNIRRVIRRVLTDPGQEAGDSTLLALASAIIPRGLGWHWNQAIMELGALVCTAAAPACWRCPLREWCSDYVARRALDEQFTAPEAPPRRRIELCGQPDIHREWTEVVPAGDDDEGMMDAARIPMAEWVYNDDGDPDLFPNKVLFQNGMVKQVSN